MILDESMRAKGKDFAGKQRGMNLEICHFKNFFKIKWQISRFYSFVDLKLSQNPLMPTTHIRYLLTQMIALLVGDVKPLALSPSYFLINLKGT